MMRVLVLSLMIACGKPAQTGPVAEAAPTPGAAVDCPSALPAIVGSFNGEDVTVEELRKVAGSQLIEAESALSQAQHEALEMMLTERAVEAAAAEENLSPEEWFQKQVSPVPPSEEEVQAFYAENSARMQGELEQMRQPIMQHLMQAKAQEQAAEVIKGLKERFKIKKQLPFYKVAVEAADSPRKGAADAPIEIIEFSDFGCPFCSMAADNVMKVKEKYGDKVSVVYRHFPLPMHPEAIPAALASECARDEGKFWEYHDKLFADQKKWTAEDLKGYAKELQLDEAKFATCLDTSAKQARLDKDMEDGTAVGMTGTPGFFINGVPLQGAVPVEAFDEIIEQMLAGKN